MATNTECVIPIKTHCGACARQMEKRIRQIGGITSAHAEHPEGRAVVQYDPERISGADAQFAVEKVAKLTTHQEVTSCAPGCSHGCTQGSTRLLAVAAVLWALGIAVLFTPANLPLLGPFALSDVFLLPAALIGGWPVLKGAWKSIRKLQLGISVLIAIAAIGAAALGESFEAASLVVLFGISEWLEHRASARARRVAEELLEETPDTAVVLRDGTELVLPVEAIEIGERLVVRPGERIGLDGTVVNGESWVDESAITGESTPASKAPGDPVYAGTLNREGALEFEATQAANGSTIARIAELVSQAMAKRPKIQRVVDRFAKVYTPIVVGLAIGVVVVPVLLGQPARPWIMRALTMLVVSCPCAFVISLPATMAAALHTGAKHGLVIKGGEYLERAARVSAVAFDKTGTLTTGELTATVVPAESIDPVTVLQLAASLESKSEHAIGQAILATAKGVELHAIEAFRALPGRGVRGVIDGIEHFLGKPSLFHRDALDNADASMIESCSVLLGTSDRILGGFRLSDRVRDESRAVVADLDRLGIQSAMVTGDRSSAAQRTASAVGVNAVHSDLLPEDKLSVIDGLRATDVVCMVGDGINDAPALAAADLGVAMGLSAATTAEAGDIVLSDGGLRGLPRLFRLARRAFRMARWNMIVAFALKAVVAILAIFGITSLALAVIVGDVGATLLVTANAVRLSRASL